MWKSYYWQSLLQEITRHCPHLALTVQHYTTGDTKVGGYFIPKGTQGSNNRNIIGQVTLNQILFSLLGLLLLRSSVLQPRLLQRSSHIQTRTLHQRKWRVCVGREGDLLWDWKAPVRGGDPRAGWAIPLFSCTSSGEHLFSLFESLQSVENNWFLPIWFKGLQVWSARRTQTRTRIHTRSQHAC